MQMLLTKVENICYFFATPTSHKEKDSDPACVFLCVSVAHHPSPIGVVPFHPLTSNPYGIAFWLDNGSSDKGNGKLPELV